MHPVLKLLVDGERFVSGLMQTWPDMCLCFVGASDGREVGEHPEDPNGAFPAQTGAIAETQSVQLSRHRHEAAVRQHGREPMTRSHGQLAQCIVGNGVRAEELGVSCF